ncbi:hypothetical protein [Brachybacterium tyrofermentans]|uniref:hypothetical protein n=1 Tax=Brachybacterium tyrofermentans TaxID=47848 RepID=UPI003FD5EDD8
MSRVVGAGYVDQLAGPSLVGAAAGLVRLNLTFVLPFLFCLLGVVIARIVTPEQQSAPDATAPGAEASSEVQ